MKGILNKELSNALEKDKDVIAVLLFGSYARGEEYRDIDICIVLDKKHDNLNMSKKRLKYLSMVSNKFDIQIFQQLPVYIRKRILKEGKILLSKNDVLLYEIAFSTIKEFGLYEKLYDMYLEKVKHG